MSKKELKPKTKTSESIHFVSANVYKRIGLFEYNKEFCELFIENMLYSKENYNFKIFAFVIMPDHFHMIIKTSKTVNIQKVMMVLKGYTARQIMDIISRVSPSDEKANRRSYKVSLYRKHKIDTKNSSFRFVKRINERYYKYIAEIDNIELLKVFRYKPRNKRDSTIKIFQKNEYDFDVVTPRKMKEKINYIHNNPVRWELCKGPEDYPYSSANAYYRGDFSLVDDVGYLL